MWLHSPLLDCLHGFSTRHGGCSPAPFDSLNLGGFQDDQLNIRKNRILALDDLGLSIDDLCLLEQVHGSQACKAKRAVQTGDALVTSTKGLILAITAADCYPVLFHDAKAGVIGAAHAGWRGILNGVISNTVKVMVELGASMSDIKIAIGPGISLNRFEVGSEVIETFKNTGFPSKCFSGNKLDLIKSIIFILSQLEILGENIWTMNRCTFNDTDFFSYRRDTGVTGRMWGLITL
jgi:polyphenol oxidase